MLTGQGTTRLYIFDYVESKLISVSYLIEIFCVLLRDVQPEEEVKVEHSFTPQTAGRQKLVGTFSSKELLDITGSAVIEIFEEEEYIEHTKNLQI